MTQDNLEFSIDKFTFRIATDRLYTSEGLWVKQEGYVVRTGLSDYLEQRSGDIAFVEVKPAGTPIKPGDELAVIETIKVNISLSSPVRGIVLEINPVLQTAPELINQDPYDKGWLAMIDLAQRNLNPAELLTAQAYFSQAKFEAEQESGTR